MKLFYQAQCTDDLPDFAALCDGKLQSQRSCLPIMLTETFVASTSTSSAIKDASIFVHQFQPQPSIRTSFKKSATARNCLTATPSHIFAAQAEKAVVHVYNREKGNQETLVPFPERIHSISSTVDGAILVLGTEDGRIFVWEVGCHGQCIEDHRLRPS